MRTSWLTRSALMQGSAEFLILIGPNQQAQDVKFVSGSEALRPAVDSIKTLKFNQTIPDNSATLILRRGTLYCGQSSPKCSFVLLPIDSVRTVE